MLNMSTDVEKWCNSTFENYESIYTLRESTLMQLHHVLVWLSVVLNVAFGGAIILQNQVLIKKYIENILLTISYYINAILFLRICYEKTDLNSTFLLNRLLRFNGSTQGTVMIFLVVEKLISISPLLQGVCCKITILRRTLLLATIGIVHGICTGLVSAEVHFKVGITFVLLILALFMISTKKLIKAFGRRCEFVYLLWIVCSFSSLVSIAFMVTAINNDYCPMKGTLLMQVSLFLYGITFLSNPIAFYLKFKTEQDKYMIDYHTNESCKLSAPNIDTLRYPETKSSEPKPKAKLIYLDMFNETGCKREDVIDFTDQQPLNQSNTVLPIQE